MKKAYFVLALFAGAAVVPFFAAAVTVGPVRLEYSANPGDVVRGNLFVQNEGKTKETYYPSFEKFTEENGEKVFSKEKTGLVSWIQTISSITLNPGEGQQIPFAITVPNDAPPGGHFAVIWWSSTPPGQQNEQVAIVSRAGILVYLQVSGNIQESGKITSLTASQKVIFDSSPIDFTVTFQNNGNSYLKPNGEIVLKNILGITQASAAINPFGVVVLPQSKKDLTMTLKPPAIAFGPYRAEARIFYGQNKEEITQSIWIWILPWTTTAWILVFLVFVFFLIPRGIRRYNQWVISRAKSK